MFEGVPKSYKDPYWRNLASKAAQDVGLPSGLLEGILTRGERSNADQVSNAGAKTPFQVIPQTRDALQKKYGVDAYESPESAARAAALLLKESLERNDGDITQAVGEYIGGTNRKNWGPVTNAYIKRVTEPLVEKNDRVSELVKKFKELKNPEPTTETPERNDKVSELVARFKEKQGQSTKPPPGKIEDGFLPGVIPEPFGMQPDQQKRETSILEDVAGVGETALALGSGATTGLLGGVTSGLIGIIDAASKGEFGDEGAKIIENAFITGLRGGTYSPRTETGQRMTRKTASALSENLPPIMPIIGPVGAVTSGIAPAAQAVKGTAQRIRQMVPVADEVVAASRPVEQAASVAQAAEKAIPEAQAFEEVGSLVKKASSEGLGSQKAKEQLASMAKVNPEAKAAAERLNIELPADVFSDNPQVVAAAGLTRSAAGSEAEAAWRTTVKNASDRADEVMETLDASTDVASVSDNVRQRLFDTKKGLEDSAKVIYDEVDAAIPKSTAVELDSLRQQIQKTIDEVGINGLNSTEKKLKAMIDSGEPITYGRMMREKSILGDKLGGKTPFDGDLDTASAKRLYGALSEDQLENVSRFGGEELRTKLRGANALYAKKRALEKRIVNAYGNDTDGSIASLMKRAVSNAQKGDSKDLTKLLKVVPDDLKKETLATAIMANTRSKSANSLVKGGFGFSEFTDFYRGLRRNTPVYNQVKQVMGDDAMSVLRDMYEVSKRVTDARANVLTTGKANQALVNAMQAEGVMEAIIKKAATGAGRAAATTAGATMMGPLGAGAVNLATDFLAKGSKSKLEAAGKLFTNEKFQEMMKQASTKPAASPEVKKSVRFAVRTPEFIKFAKQVKLTGTPLEYERFMLSAMAQRKEEE